jgi:hypothetical protein
MTNRRGKPNGREEVLSPVCQTRVSSVERRAKISRYAGRRSRLIGVVGSASGCRVVTRASIVMYTKSNTSVVCG